MSAMEQARFPIIAVVQGACIGGGLDLASGCDLRVATADAYFCVQEIHMGLVADLGVLQRLSALIPPAMVRELAFTGRRLKADEATRLGFVNRVAPDIEAFLGVARELAADISAKSPLAIWGTKEILNDFDRRRIEDGLRYVAAWNSGMFMPEDVQKSVAAAKRKQPTSYRNLLPVDAPAIPQGRTTVKGLTDVQ
jgi:enoyl-CoA hydratase